MIGKINHYYWSTKSQHIANNISDTINKIGYTVLRKAIECSKGSR